MANSILLINGPNLNLLGERQPDQYGHARLAEVEAQARALANGHGLELSAMQSNHEGAILDAIHAARGRDQAIIINAGAFTHSSIAILDALNAYDGIVIEVHISQVHRREAFRHHSYISARADAVIVGCGVQGYDLAILRIAALVNSL